MDLKDLAEHKGPVPKIEFWLHTGIVAVSLFTFLYWFTGKGLFYSDTAPVLSPFTSFSLLLMSGSRLAEKTIETWSKPMTLALLGLVACGNISSVSMLLLVPELFFESLPAIVPTSIMTSCGLVAFCFYEILVVVRKTPNHIFIVDDILIHLALFPGGLSLIGHMLDIPYYISSAIDPRAGISFLEMGLMGSYAIVAVISNPNLFLWRFLAAGRRNQAIFGVFFLNQYIAPIVVGYVLIEGQTGPHTPGLEFFVMCAGVLTTLVFLILVANFYTRREILNS